MAVGERFDLEAAREAARLKKQRELVKKIVSNVVLVVVLLVTGISIWLGVRWYREKCAREEAARQEAARQAAEQRRIENEKRAEQRRIENEKRERERKEHAEKVARERAEREAAREREIAERERQKEEAAARLEKERLEREERERRAKFAKEFLRDLQFDVTDHYVVEFVVDASLAGVEVGDARWAALSTAVATPTTPVFFDLMRPAAETNDLDSVGTFPDENTMMNRRKALDAEKFTMTISLKPGVDGRPFGVYAFDAESGVVEAPGVTEIRQKTRLAGWTVPFAFGGGANVLVMTDRTARRLQGEWQRQVRLMKRQTKDAEAAAVEAQLREALENFAKTVRTQLRVEPPKPTEEKPVKKNWRDRNREGKNDSIRGFGRGGSSFSRGGRSSGRSLGGARLR